MRFLSVCHVAFFLLILQDVTLMSDFRMYHKFWVACPVADGACLGIPSKAAALNTDCQVLPLTLVGLLCCCSFSLGLYETSRELLLCYPGPSSWLTMSEKKTPEHELELKGWKVVCNPPEKKRKRACFFRAKCVSGHEFYSGLQNTNRRDGSIHHMSTVTFF